MLMRQKWITARVVIGAELPDGRIHPLQQNKKRLYWAFLCCSMFCWRNNRQHGVRLHTSSSASRAFIASSIVALTVKRWTVDALPVGSVYFFSCCLSLLVLKIWVSGAQGIITRVHKVCLLFSVCVAALQSAECWHHWLEVWLSGWLTVGENCAPPPPQLHQNTALRSRAGGK